MAGNQQSLIHEYVQTSLLTQTKYIRPTSYSLAYMSKYSTVVTIIITLYD